MAARLIRILTNLLFVSLTSIAAAQTTQTATYGYNSNGQVTTVTYDNGTTIAYTYDGNGNVTSILRTSVEALSLGQNLGIEIAGSGQSAPISFTEATGQSLSLNLSSVGTNPPGGSISITVLNAAGQTVLTSSFSQSESLPLVNLPAGSYTAVFSSAAGSTATFQVGLTASGGGGGGGASGSLGGTTLGTLTTANLTSVGTSDWAHWPEFTEKATGSARISNYTLVGSGSVETYDNATLALTWTDGTPTGSGNATTGAFVSGVGNGFQITVPADTTSRQLTLYVGGWSSAGKLTAHLSDGSAADFVDASYSSSSDIYQANYTLTYNAASAGQTLTVTWVTTTDYTGTGDGNVVLDGGALAAGSAPTAPATPTGLSATQGTSTTGVGVSWSASSGATGYSIYRSTASGTQGAVLTTTASTSYLDTSAVPGTTYYYSVAATNAVGSSAVSTQVSGYVPVSPTGALSGVGLGNLSTASLTTVGTSDWAHWPEFTEKATGNSQISNYTVVGSGSANSYGDAPLSLTWSDGSPTGTGNATTGLYVKGVGNGFQITVPADTNSRQLTLYVGGWESAGTLSAHLSDGSAADFTDTSYSSTTGTYQANYTLSYHAASAGQTLTITWVMTTDYSGIIGNVVLDGAALAGGSGPSAPATPTGLSASQGTSSSGVAVSWNAASGATSYKLYRSTASGTQGPILTTTASTSYLDTSAVPGTTYYYSVAATNTVGSSAVSAQVSGYVPVAATGALSGVGLGTLTSANLTSIGTSDWAHWPEFTEKATGNAQISNYALVGSGSANTYGDATLTLSWSDGSPTGTGNATTGSFVAGVGNGFQIAVPADTTARQFTLYVGGWSSAGRLTAHLSDGSAADFVDSSYSSSSGIYQANYTLNYHAASAGQTLTITWVTTTDNTGWGGGNVVLDGAALH